LRLVSRYVRDSYLVTFLITLCVLTFVMCVMVLFRIADPIAMGGSLRLIATIFLAGLPSAFGFSIPVSIITAALLTFGKLSANGEITAMKSSGIRMLQIMRQPILFALLMSALCLYMNAELIPRSYHARREALRQLGIASPLQLIEEGRPIRDFPGLVFYIGAKKGNRIEDVLIFQQHAGKAPRTIRARSGTITPVAGQPQLLVDLQDVRVDPFYEDRPGPGTAGRFPFVIDLGKLAGAATPGAVKKKSDMTLRELGEGIADIKALYPELEPESLARQQMALRVEFHKRIVMALSCFVFVLLGAPLATRTHRQETTLGIGISLGLVFCFYLFVIVAETLTRHPLLQPHLIVWLPVLLAAGLGVRLIRRCD
jgi:lipopolysaccharide export system permease protein